MALDDETVLMEIRALRADIKAEFSDLEKRLTSQLSSISVQVKEQGAKQEDLRVGVETFKAEAKLLIEDLQESRNRSVVRFEGLEKRIEPLEKNATVLERLTSSRAKTAEWVVRWLPIAIALVYLYEKFFGL